MKITKVSVAAGRTVQHPTQDFANTKHNVMFEAEIEDGDDPKQVMKDLQRDAESAVEQHVIVVHDSIRKLVMITDRKQRIDLLKQNMEKFQKMIDDVEADIEEASQGNLLLNASEV